MQTSRMHTARSSSRWGGLHQAPPDQTPQDQAPLPGPDPPGAGTPHPGTRHPPLAQAPPVDRHTPVNILPCPKLRLRAVITRFPHCNSL